MKKRHLKSGVEKIIIYLLIAIVLGGISLVDTKYREYEKEKATRNCVNGYTEKHTREGDSYYVCK